jgi:hypothetical protein
VAFAPAWDVPVLDRKRLIAPALVAMACPSPVHEAFGLTNDEQGTLRFG